jgi:pSer/pThr/pTyr-binding forkhead associated (FHA) protein
MPRKSLLLGRDPNCDIIVADETVSRKHAELVPTENGVFVTDCNTQNGTFLLGPSGKKRIRQHTLGVSDSVLFGECEFRARDLIEEVNRLSSGGGNGSAANPVSTTYVRCKQCGTPGPRRQNCRVCGFAPL